MHPPTGGSRGGGGKLGNCPKILQFVYQFSYKNVSVFTSLVPIASPFLAPRPTVGLDPTLHSPQIFTSTLVIIMPPCPSLPRRQKDQAGKQFGLPLFQNTPPLSDHSLV